MPSPPTPFDSSLISQAHARIAAHVRRTPLLSADAGQFGAGAVSFKLELLQHAGSFKPRGAFNNLVAAKVPFAGVTAASGGNHGVAVAYAAHRLGLRARIFVPEISSPAKVAAIQAHGAEVVIRGARYADAQAACDQYVAETGALRVHPYEGETTVAGAGTVALEWEEQLRAGGGSLDTVLVAVGGGGLVAGMAAWWKGKAKGVKVVGVEPSGSRCLHAALEAGEPVDVGVESIAADALGAKRVGALAFAVARDAGVDVVLVDDGDIRAAQRALWSGYRVAAEPAGATALAALVGGAYVASPGERVGVLVCGGNVVAATLDG